MFLCLLLSVACGPSALKCKDGYNNLGLDPNGSTCKTDCECNNINYEGQCIEGLCKADRREECEVKGRKRHCLLPAAAVQACKWGIQECQPPPLEVLNWGDCKPFSVKEEKTLAPCGDGLDNDCSGTVDKSDEKCKDFCLPGKTESCYTGPAQTVNVGICSAGVRTCKDDGTWDVCKGDVKPKQGKDECNGLDDDCDGLVDEDGASGGKACAQRSVCTPGEQRNCYGGLSGCTRDETGRYVCKGSCRFGYKECRKNAAGEVEWTACQRQVRPTFEACDGYDNNCDGEIDEGCLCTAGATQPCYDGPKDAAGKGTCKEGTQACTRFGLWGPCTGQILPGVEVCNGQDDDCDGEIDEACQSLNGCTNGESRACYAGPDGTEGKGLCRAGFQLCQGGRWGSCKFAVLPGTEVCNGLDDDCNGVLDNGATCPAGFSCRQGSCRANGVPSELPAEPVSDAGESKPEKPVEAPPEPQREREPPGEQMPTEMPGDGVVNPDSSACQEGVTRSCDTDSYGPCKPGSQRCIEGSWSLCKSLKEEVDETCNGIDDDCNGLIDDNLTDQSGKVCAKQQGLCKGAVLQCRGSSGWTTSCDDTDYAAHAVAYEANETTCDTYDNDCDGVVDEGCSWVATASNFSYSRGVAIATDQQGNVYLAGNFGRKLTFGSITLNKAGNNNNRNDLFVAKMDKTGKVLWAVSAGSVGTEDNVNGIVLDKAEKALYIAGAATSPATFGSLTLDLRTSGGGLTDAYIAKLDVSDGKFLWVQGYGAAFDDSARAIGVNAAGEIIVAGTFHGSVPFGSVTLQSSSSSGHSASIRYNGFVLKLKESSNQPQVLWAKAIVSGGSVLVRGLAIDASGKIHLTGRIFRNPTFAFGSISVSHPASNYSGEALFVSQMDTNGTFLWAKAGERATSGGTGIQVDASGGLYVVSSFFKSFKWDSKILTSQDNNPDGMVLKLDSNGNAVWLSHFHSPLTDTPHALVLDGKGGLFITGHVASAAQDGQSLVVSFVNQSSTASLSKVTHGNRDTFVAKLDTSNGAFVWAELAGGYRVDDAFGIQRAADQSIYITGLYGGNTSATGAIFGTRLLPAVSHGAVFLWQILPCATKQGPSCFP